VNEDKNDIELAKVLKGKIREDAILLEQMRSQAKNKEVNLILLSYLIL